MSQPFGKIMSQNVLKRGRSYSVSLNAHSLVRSASEQRGEGKGSNLTVRTNDLSFLDKNSDTFEWGISKPSFEGPGPVHRNLSYDLVGVELNPGPVRSKKLSNLVSQLSADVASLRRQPASKRAKPGKSKQQQQQSNVMPGNNTRISGVPAAFGFVTPRSYFRTSSTAQQLTQQDPKGSVRVSGCALYGSGINLYTSNATSTSEHGGFGTSVTPDRGYAVIAPTEIDPRLAAVSQTYQFYAFRRIILRYIPFVGTSTTGGLYLAISKDTEQAEANFALIGSATPSGGTPQDVLDYDPSLMTAVWQPAMLDFQHRGTELWETYPNGEEPIDKRLQAAIVCIVESALSVSTAVTFGHLWIEYEVDFYVPGPPLGAA
jgi:hypothetical protein